MIRRVKATVLALRASDNTFLEVEMGQSASMPCRRSATLLQPQPQRCTSESTPTPSFISSLSSTSASGWKRVGCWAVHLSASPSSVLCSLPAPGQPWSSWSS